MIDVYLHQILNPLIRESNRIGGFLGKKIVIRKNTGFS